MFSAVINYLFPSKCQSCGEYSSYLCQNCLLLCDKSAENTEPWIASLFSYKNPLIKSAIWEIKYKGKFITAYAFGKMLAQSAQLLLSKTLLKWIENGEIWEDVVIVPIPPSSTGKKKRGYNQSFIIAKALFENANFPAFIEKSALVKIRETSRQALLKDRNIRIRNMKCAFLAVEKIVKDRTILLVDDVTTTGATLIDARRALLQAGAKEVFAVTIGH